MVMSALSEKILEWDEKPKQTNINIYSVENED